MKKDHLDPSPPSSFLSPSIFSASSAMNLSSSPPPRRKRGAPPGNKNALKHGYYANVQPYLSPAALPDPTSPDIDQNIHLIYAFVRDLELRSLDDPKFANSLVLLRGITLAQTALARYHRAQFHRSQTANIRVLTTLNQTLTALLEQIKAR